ncbi:DUF1488 domain-containing protein [Pseudoalteromonas denitrificans]|uniref:DUF1488 domain-containing protein n=1 Tax=Pseudoalteromonas denitrificans DSM 6059 TaxID=1123010 RepID=A0A1I1JPT1_9GAMM|nr:DUF1488 domain-containing protein [Pseudoalteromonas denitrificans]SFC50496.1 Protein of unknown function [Pseudoalteromonas denitrificans DSM 6059]
MNQAIQFVDRYTYIKARNVIQFEAIVSGMIVFCFVKYSGKDVNDYLDNNKFDLEELATELIEEEAYNEQGEIWIK